MQGTQDTRLCALIERLHGALLVRRALAAVTQPAAGGSDQMLTSRSWSISTNSTIRSANWPAMSSRYTAEPVWAS